MSFPAKANFNIKANGYWEKVWKIYNLGEPMDLSGYSFELEVKITRGKDSPRILNLTMGSGIEVDDPLTGEITVTIPPMPDLKKTKTYAYDFIAIKNSKATVWIQGLMTFDPGVSYYGS